MLFICHNLSVLNKKYNAVATYWGILQLPPDYPFGTHGSQVSLSHEDIVPGSDDLKLVTFGRGGSVHLQPGDGLQRLEQRLYRVGLQFDHRNGFKVFGWNYQSLSCRNGPLRRTDPQFGTWEVSGYLGAGLDQSRAGDEKG